MSLIEVLVSLVIFSIGVLGVVGLQARATQFSVSAEDRTRAALLANEITAQMWAKQSTTLEAGVVADWRSRVKDATASGLPNADGTISPPDTEGVVTIEITWRSPARPQSEGLNRYVTKVTLP